MPQRKVILATDETYHIFSRGLRKIPIFTNKKEFQIFLLATKYYLQIHPPTRFSIFRQQTDKYKIDQIKSLVKVIAYCLMPNHFHFILTQLEEDGIKKFTHRLLNSYAHYFNLNHNQKGSIFEDRFKAVRVESQEQLAHLSRYIHLNPVTSFIVEDPLEYKYSSYKVYLNKEISDFVDPSDVMVDFKTPRQYQSFVLSQKDYQRELDRIKHLTFD